MVGFAEERALGESANSQRMRNVKNTLTDMKRLLGRRYSDPQVQTLLATMPYEHEALSEDRIGLKVRHDGKQVVFTPQQVVAMLLVHLKGVAERGLNSPVGFSVLSVPIWYSDTQRRALRDAATIAGFPQMRLFSEPAAAGYAYGIKNLRNLPEEGSEPLKLAIVDMGHCSLTVAIYSMTRTEMKMLATAHQVDIGGQAIDQAMMMHFVEAIKEKHKMDVSKNSRAMLRLQAACEKLKKVLSANPEAPLQVESIMNDTDVRLPYTRDELEKLIQPILARVKDTCACALERSGVSAADLAAVEIIGGSVRIPAVKSLLTEAFDRPLSQTLNSEECIARGCAWQCAMLSPVFRMKPFKAVDLNPFAVSVKWGDAAAADPNAMSDEADEAKLLFTKQQTIPSTKVITIPRRESLALTAFYGQPEDLVSGVPGTIGRFEVLGLAAAYAKADAENLVEPPKLQLRVRMDPSGVFSVVSAQLVKLLQPDPVADAADAKKAADEKKAAAASGDAKPEEGETMDTSPDDAAPAGDQKEPQPKQTKKEAKKQKEEAKKEAAKPRQMVVTLSVAETIVDTLNEDELKAAAQHELDMVARDTEIRTTAEARNQLESYVYDFRAKISYESLGEFVEEAPKADFLSKLQEMEDWLYTEEADTCGKVVFEAKYATLKAIGDEIVLRQREAEARPLALAALTTALVACKELTESTDEKYLHIAEEERNKAREAIAEAQKWLDDINAKLATYQKTQNPVVLAADIEQRQQALQKRVDDIMLKPAPKPAEDPITKPATADDAAKTEEPKPAEVDPAAAAQLPEDGLDPPPVEPMDMD
mmetsp:Transcript_29842/g.75055  ORF Transcript_29842/g.75055 Transcript_29842/m.75055 type:complete len:820 (+) Transcript_29842:260-2719(+)|eukprot:CAMPEP_0177650094 /NCGR_PEP_ID=MMETSP0447-20121125/11746_1 /TAXON_ID=0 /ORGANISM="Stygamoeba regulata, Strain BSH-02190019" /LENGTH=819 /DNA_ID=CAMNT_0019152915 /DNA_START=223 /DNA_END=2682 /DNA_ORIENTATION=+